MKRRAIIDIGSNSLRLIIYEVSVDLEVDVITQGKKTIRLGSYLTKDNYLSDDGIEMAIKVLNNFKIMCGKYDVVSTKVVATEAMRRAKNKEDICNKIKEKLDYDVRILTGEQEAWYGYLAIRNSMEIEDAILLDVGGSSMEISLMKDGALKQTICLPLGCIALTKMFNNIENFTDEIYLNKYIQNTLKAIPWLEENSQLNVIGIGGIAKHIGRVSKGDKDYPIADLHDYSMTIEEILGIKKEFFSLPMEKRSEFKGLSKQRSEIFAAPLRAILTILQYINSERYIINSLGLREGIICEEVIYK